MLSTQLPQMQIQSKQGKIPTTNSNPQPQIVSILQTIGLEQPLQLNK